MIKNKPVSEMTKKERNEYVRIHYWLKNNYGKACQCNYIGCEDNCETFEWALIHGFNHEKKRSNYWQLCNSCHNNYDGYVASENIVFKQENFSRLEFRNYVLSKVESLLKGSK